MTFLLVTLLPGGMPVQRILKLAAATAMCVFAIQASAASGLLDFEDGTDQGFGAPFGDGSTAIPVVDIGGSLRLEVLRDGGFQESDIGSGSDPFLAAANAAATNPSGHSRGRPFATAGSP